MFSGAEFYITSLSTNFEKAQHNVVMIGGKDFFLFMPSLRKLHTRSLLGHGFVSFVAEQKTWISKKNWISVMLQLYVCILQGTID